MGAGRLISLCARVTPELSPAETIDAAVLAGYGAVGFAFDDTADLDQRLARELRARLADSPIECLDADVIRIRPGPEDPGHYRFIEHVAEIGAKHVLVVTHDPDPAATAAKFAMLCQHAAERDLGLVLEFMIITGCKTLDDAVSVVRLADQPNGKVLIDTLHVARAGHKPSDIGGYDDALFPYVQLSDGPAAIDVSDHEACLHDAREGRLSPGEGELPLHEMLRHIDDATPISVEVRSRRYCQVFPDARIRARVVFEKTTLFLSQE